MNAFMKKEVDYTKLPVDELAIFIKKQEFIYKQLKQDGDIESIEAEKIYAKAKVLFFEKLETKKREKSSENLYELLQQPDEEELDKRLLPIDKLNWLLRNKRETELNIAGGISDGGFFAQIIAPSGVGKSTLMMALCLGLSANNKTAWLDFERGWIDFKREVLSFTAKTKNKYNVKNIEYLDGFKASDELSFIIEEITLLAYIGVKDFFIDSFMAIKINGENDTASWAKEVSLAFMALAKELSVNIWIINQISAKDEEAGRRQPIFGHASRYASDYMFFIQKIPKIGADGRAVKDDVGQPVYDTTKRLLTCDKNRYDKSHGEGNIELTEDDIYGISGISNEPFEVIYSEENSNIDFPMI